MFLDVTPAGRTQTAAAMFVAQQARHALDPGGVGRGTQAVLARTHPQRRPGPAARRRRPCPSPALPAPCFAGRGRSAAERRPRRPAPSTAARPAPGQSPRRRHGWPARGRRRNGRRPTSHSFASGDAGDGSPARRLGEPADGIDVGTIIERPDKDTGRLFLGRGSRSGNNRDRRRWGWRGRGRASRSGDTDPASASLTSVTACAHDGIGCSSLRRRRPSTRYSQERQPVPAAA